MEGEQSKQAQAAKYRAEVKAKLATHLKQKCVSFIRKSTPTTSGASK